MRNEVLPFEVERGFIAIPNVIFTHYSFYPKFNGTTIRVYAYLLKLYNRDYGYAFPTQMQAMADLGISDKTFRESVKLLEEMRLIRVGRSEARLNNVYYFEKPIENEAEFFTAFPKAAEVKRKKDATVAKMKPKKEEARRKMVEDTTNNSVDITDISDWL